ncbi:MAG: hypothetical protein ACTSVY_14835 [Candidatus Helarchaeota archaeon]
MVTFAEEIKAEINDLIEQKRPGAVISLGSEFKNDGVTPINITDKILNILPKTYIKILTLAEGGEQHFLPDIKKLNPEYLILIDMVDQGKPPGTISLIKKDVLLSNENPCVFGKSKDFTKFLESLPKETKVVAIAIQGKDLEFGVVQSAELGKAEDEVLKILQEIGVFKGKE